MRGSRDALASLAGVVGLCAAAAPSLVLAQSVLPAIQPGERVQSIGLVGQVIYDSNVAGSDAVSAASRNIRPADVIFEPAIRFDLARPIGRETVYLQGTAGYDFYSRNSFLNRENLDIRPGVLSSIGRCQINVGGDYSRAQSDLSQLAITPAGTSTIVAAQNVLQVEQVAASASCGGAIGLAPTASVSQTWSQNSSPLQRFTNANTFSASAGLSYRRPTFGDVSIFGAFSHTTYPDRAGFVAFNLPGISGGYDTYSGGLRYSRPIGSRLEVTASISYTILQQIAEAGGAPAVNGAQGNFSGPTYSGAVSYKATSRLTASVQVSRATVPSIRLNSNYGLNELYSGELDYRLGTRITLRGGASYNQTHYNGIPYAQNGIDVTEESTTTGFVSADMRINKRLSVGVNVAQSQRNANFPGLSYPETRAALTFGINF